MINQLWSEEKYTTEELNARLKFFIGIILGLTLFGIVFVVLYSLIFVTQPMNGMSPVDNKFFELIIPVATFLTGTLSGIMLAGNNPEAQQEALKAANKGWDKPTSPTPTNGGSNGGFNSSPGGFAIPSTPAAGGFSTTTGFGAPTPVSTGAFGGAGFGEGTPSVQPAVVMGFGGKPAPVQPPHPEI